MKIDNYIEEHKVCTELIFRDWIEFLNLLFSSGGKVNAILWYDYCRIQEQEKSLGCGGYKDVCQDGYMWAETQLYEDGLENKLLFEMLEYIEDVRNKYYEHDLYPSFYIQ